MSALATFEVSAQVSAEVSAKPAEVAAFCRAARLEEADQAGDALPFTYPIRWMAHPDVRAALTALLQETDLAPFHESQTFDYAAPLRMDVPYRLTVAARRESAPDRLILDGCVGVAGGPVLATIETVLRLFPTLPAAA